MFLSELAEPQLIVIYPGRFQPFHKGHHAVYDWLTGKFGRNNVFIATSNKVEGDRSPFSFAEKAYFMQLTGVPADRIIQATQPYQIDSVMASGQINASNPQNTVVIFAVSEKDMAEDPRFSFKPKKDGSAPYFQPLRDIKQTESMDKHGYIMTVPTFDFKVLGQPMQSASELRAQYKTADEKTRQAIVKDLFGRYTPEAEQIMNSKLAPANPVAPPRPNKSPKMPVAAGLAEDNRPVDLKAKELIGRAKAAHPSATSDEEALAMYVYDKEQRDIDRLDKEQDRDDEEISKLDAYRDFLATEIQNLRDEIASLKQGIANRSTVKEDAAGVGVVRNGKDPRYVMATTGLQNAVDDSTLGKEIAAFYPTKAPKTRQVPVKRNVGRG